MARGSLYAARNRARHVYEFIAQCVRDGRDGMTAEEISEALGYTLQQLASILAALSLQGKVRNTGLKRDVPNLVGPSDIWAPT